MLAAFVRKGHDFAVALIERAPTEEKAALSSALSARVDEVAVLVDLTAEPLSFRVFPIHPMSRAAFVAKRLND
jgi:hypothetical protein